MDAMRRSISARRCAVEVRNPAVLGDDGACRRLQEAAILVSADSPEVQERIFPGVVIYLRVHGRGPGTATIIPAANSPISGTESSVPARSGHIFFNNDHAMLENARAMMRLFAGVLPARG